MKMDRALLRIVGVGSLLVGGVFALSTCNKPVMTDAEFEQLCKVEAHVEVLNPVLWEKYVQLAKDYGADIYGRPTLVEREGFTVLFGKAREGLKASFPDGIHDDEIAILYSGEEIAILHDKVMVNSSIDFPLASGCNSSHGLDLFIENVRS